MASNRAAWLTEAKGYPLQVKTAPYPTPSKGQLVVRNHTLAFNPVDRAVQSSGPDFLDWVKYPIVLSSDIAGEVVEVGSSAISRFKPGDRVFGHALNFAERSAHGGAQEYVLLCENRAGHIPDSMAYAQAAVLPLGASTAGHARASFTYSASKTIVWDGSTSVGSNAIQLAAAAGFQF